MKEIEAGEKLARSLVDTGAAMGKRFIALLTDMDQPLGRMVGNFVEVEEALDCLEGKGPPDLMEISLELAARMAVLGGKAASTAEGRRLCEEALAGGRPRALFLANIASQGGDVDRFLSLRGSYRSPVRGEVRAERGGVISRIDAWKVGHAGVQLGVGRNRTDETVSPTAGIRFHKKAGDPVAPGEPVMTVWARDEPGLAGALPRLEEAVEYAGAPPAVRKLILKEIAST
jgi:pyrimidine-nucleoside phosphorylase